MIFKLSGVAFCPAQPIGGLLVPYQTNLLPDFIASLLLLEAESVITVLRLRPNDKRFLKKMEVDLVTLLALINYIDNIIIPKTL